MLSAQEHQGLGVAPTLKKMNELRMQHPAALFERRIQPCHLLGNDLSISPLDAIKQQNKGIFNLGLHREVMNNLIPLLPTLSAFAITYPNSPRP